MPRKRPVFPKGTRIRVTRPKKEVLYEGPERRGRATRRSSKGKIVVAVKRAPASPVTVRGKIRDGILKMEQEVRDRAAADSSFADLPEAARLSEIKGALVSRKQLSHEQLREMLADLEAIMSAHNIK